jgi:hypothetical protein
VNVASFTATPVPAMPALFGQWLAASDEAAKAASIAAYCRGKISFTECQQRFRSNPLWKRA